MHTIYEIATLDDLREITDVVLKLKRENSEQALCIALSGELGVGKTAFVQALAAQLGVAEVVTSPTFTIMRSYDIEHAEFDTLVHMDAYRLESGAELQPLHVSEILTNPRAIFCIEWPERIEDQLPEDRIRLSFEIMDGETRRVELFG